jgi:hypothetical protein
MSLSGMRSARSSLHDWTDHDTLTACGTAVSLHAHTTYSHECLGPVPAYLERIPIVGTLFRRELRAYQARNGQAVDFTKGWWHPPVSPRAVWDSEVTQIVQSLGRKPLVSITDHDSIEAGVELRAERVQLDVPISFEWTVPFEQSFFHVGVHHLRPADAKALFEALSAYTQRPDEAGLNALLAELQTNPTTLLVLNHPLWDLAGIGSADHVKLLRLFLAEHGAHIHALEVNGYRTRHENDAVGRVADAWSLPLISGGDRHGRAPNSLLNLTTATSFDDFVREIREERVSQVVALPSYRERLTARKLTVAADVVRPDPSAPGKQCWTDRVSCEVDGITAPLTFHWPEGGPFWVRSAMRTFQVLTCDPLLPFVTTLTDAIARTTERPSPAAYLEGGDAPFSAAAP